MQDFASCSDIVQGPRNATVLSGSNANFTCTVQANWQVIYWSLNGVFVVSISSTEGTIISSNKQIVARNSTNNINGEFTTEITIINVTKNDSGTVTCNSFSASFQEAYLMVQVKGSVQVVNSSSVTVTPNSTVSIFSRASGWYPAPTITWKINDAAASSIQYTTDYTTGADNLVSAVSVFTITVEADTNLTCLALVQTMDAPLSTTVTIAVREYSQGTSSGLRQTDIILIAVFASLGGLLLLAVIIALIVIFCCKKKKKKKKETGYQSDSWRAPPQQVRDLQTIDRFGLGEDNNAYTPEPLSVAPSTQSSDSDSAFYEPTPRSSISKMPTGGSHDYQGPLLLHVVALNNAESGADISCYQPGFVSSLASPRQLVP
ncbi:immunoglobulin superfamily member 5 [Mantella aurantiaca]